MKRAEHWTRPELKRYQAVQLQKLRQRVYAQSPFYQEFHKGLYDAPLDELPVITKEIAMSHFDDLVTDRNVTIANVRRYMDHMRPGEKFQGKYRIVTTSGSTGRPGITLFTEQEWTSIMAFLVGRLGQWTGVKPSLTHRVTMAAVASTSPFHMSAQGGSTFLKKLLMPGIMFAANEPTERMVAALNKLQPEVLSVYASIGRLLAIEQDRGHLSIAPRTILSGSEVLTDEMRHSMERAWGNIIFNTYAATEIGGIALECDRHEGMHLMEDRMICEVVDANNQPVPAGTFGDKLLVTGFFKYTQPLIRYEISDSIRLATKACSCGRPFLLIDSIQGRHEECLELPAKKKGATVSIHPLVFHNILDTQPITGWQLTVNKATLRLVVSGAQGSFNETTIKQRLVAALTEGGALAPSLEIRRVEALPRDASGKITFIKTKSN